MSVITWFALLLLLVGSALAVVYSKHQSRKVFADIQTLERKMDDYQVEWGQLQLELETWAEHGRVERKAKQQLKMGVPNREDTRYVRP
jgi:cell division protein FtsL